MMKLCAFLPESRFQAGERLQMNPAITAGDLRNGRDRQTDLRRDGLVDAPPEATR